MLFFRSPVELSSNHHCIYLIPITTNAIMITVPTKLVAANTRSCNNIVGLGVVSELLIPNVSFRSIKEAAELTKSFLG